jgi:hypothetical protein
MVLSGRNAYEAAQPIADVRGFLAALGMTPQGQRQVQVQEQKQRQGQQQRQSQRIHFCQRKAEMGHQSKNQIHFCERETEMGHQSKNQRKWEAGQHGTG